MIRSNIGNMVTNATQTLSISGTTAARVLGRADKTLLNKPSLNEEEQARYDQMKVDKQREELSQWEEKTNNAFRRLSGDEQVAYREAQADKMRKFANSSGDEDGGTASVDDVMAGTEIRDGGNDVKAIVDAVIPENLSEQSKSLNRITINDVEYKQKWFARSLVTGQIVKVDNEILEKELEKYANV